MLNPQHLHGHSRSNSISSASVSAGDSSTGKGISSLGSLVVRVEGLLQRLRTGLLGEQQLPLELRALRADMATLPRHSAVLASRRSDDGDGAGRFMGGGANSGATMGERGSGADAGDGPSSDHAADDMIKPENVAIRELGAPDLTELTRQSEIVAIREVGGLLVRLLESIPAASAGQNLSEGGSGGSGAQQQLRRHQQGGLPEKLEGYLDKQSDRMIKGWQRRWFALTPDYPNAPVLRYYKTREACLRGDKAKGEIALAAVGRVEAQSAALQFTVALRVAGSGAGGAEAGVGQHQPDGRTRVRSGSGGVRHRLSKQSRPRTYRFKCETPVVLQQWVDGLSALVTSGTPQL